jgi:hypothetical protein
MIHLNFNVWQQATEIPELSGYWPHLNTEANGLVNLDHLNCAQDKGE